MKFRSITTASFDDADWAITLAPEEVCVARVYDYPPDVLLRQTDPPSRATEGSVGWDVQVHIPTGERYIHPGEIVVIETDFAIACPRGIWAMLCLRSSAGKKGLSMPHGFGVIDEDYRGELKIVVQNVTGEPITVRHRERIAQLIFQYTTPVRLKEVAALPDTERGAGGFGSTGG